MLSILALLEELYVGLKHLRSLPARLYASSKLSKVAESKLLLDGSESLAHLASEKDHADREGINMPTMTDRQVVVLNATIQNVLAGKIFEFVQRPSVLRLYATASVVGLNVSFVVGSRVIVDDQEVNAQNRMPIIPDDLFAEAGARSGERIVVRLRNTTGGSITAFTRLDTIAVR